MHFEAKYAGKWVATKQSKVVDSSKELDTLMKKMAKQEDKKNIRFALIPKHCL